MAGHGSSQLAELNENRESFSARGNIEFGCRSHPNFDSGREELVGSTLVVRFDEPWQRQRICVQRYAVCPVDDTLEAVISCLIGAHSLDSIQDDDNSRDTWL